MLAGDLRVKKKQHKHIFGLPHPHGLAARGKPLRLAASPTTLTQKKQHVQETMPIILLSFCNSPHRSTWQIRSGTDLERHDAGQPDLLVPLSRDNQRASSQTSSTACRQQTSDAYDYYYENYQKKTMIFATCFHIHDLMNLFGFLIHLVITSPKT